MTRPAKDIGSGRGRRPILGILTGLGAAGAVACCVGLPTAALGIVGGFGIGAAWWLGGAIGTLLIAVLLGAAALARHRHGASGAPHQPTRKRIVMTVEVFFDYTCGFSHRAQRWLGAVTAVEVVWRPFSLLEQKHHDVVAVFDQPDLADNVSLMALAVHEAVRAADGDLDGYRRRMFSAWHDETGRLSTDDVVGFGREAGLGEFDREAAFASLAADHVAGRALGVFGTPTFVFGSGQVAFVKLDAVPAQDRADPLFDRVRQLATGEPSLREWQRVSAPSAS